MKNRRAIELAVVAAGAAVALWLGVIQPYRLNLVLRDVEKRTATAFRLPPFEAADLANENLERLSPLRGTFSLGLEAATLQAANERILSRTDDAIASYSTAIAIEPRPELYEYRAMLELQSGRRSAAAADYARAAAFAPSTLDRIEDPALRAEVTARLR